MQIKFYKLHLYSDEDTGTELAVKEYSLEHLYREVLRNYRAVSKYIDLDCVEGEVKEVMIWTEPPENLEDYKEFGSGRFYNDSTNTVLSFDLDKFQWRKYSLQGGRYDE